MTAKELMEMSEEELDKLDNPDISTSWNAYPKSLAVGHRYLTGIFEDPVTVTEKIDGSQFSFGIFNGEIRCRSKNQEIPLDEGRSILGMFGSAVDTVKKMADQLKDGYTYRAEYLKKPKHNVLAYDRVPKNFLIIFDIARGQEDYLDYTDMAAESERIGMECVPLIYWGKILDPDLFLKLIDCESILGGNKVEGVVAKNYDRFGKDGRVLMAKFVSPKFKEVHNKDWKERNPAGIDIITKLGLRYHSEARFAKGVQHLKEAGVLLGEPRDIGNLIKEVKKDVYEECADEIKETLFAWAWPKIQKATTSGLPDWYKSLLIAETFIETED
jgi:hypothetical protein